MEEKVFIGYSYGKFQTDDGRMQDYCNVFVLEPFAGQQSDQYHFAGQRAMKYGCISPNVFQGIKFGEKVKCFFDSKKKVSYMVPADQVSKAIPGGKA